MIIHPLPILTDNYVWILINPSSKTAYVIDPGEAKPVKQFLKAEDLELKGILLTHHHWDHTNGVLGLLAQDMPVYANENSPHSFVTHRLGNGEQFSLADLPEAFRAIAIPGHTLDHTAYVIQDHLFSGDTLFSAGCGKIFEGTFPMMFQSLQKLLKLPDTTKLYCGHEYTLKNLQFAKLVEPQNNAIDDHIVFATEAQKKGLPSLPSTLKTEKLINPFLRCHERSVIKSAESYAKTILSTEIDVFKGLRQWKDDFNAKV